MTISTDPSTAAAGKSRQATDKSVEVFTNAAHTNQIESVKLPTIDLTEPVARYLEFLRRVVDFNCELATHWAEFCISLSGSVREQVEQVGSIVRDQTDTFAVLASRQAKNAEQAVKEQTERPSGSSESRRRKPERPRRPRLA